MTEFGFIVAYEPGSLVGFLETLAEEDVSIEAIAGITAEATGIIRLITDRPDATRDVLRGLGMQFEEREAVRLEVPHRPGELAALLSRLAKEGIDVLSCYAGVQKNDLILTVDRLDEARRMLHAS
jgi:hypothetical protein